MSESEFDAAQVDRFRSGDEHAFVELFWQHRERLKRMLLFRIDKRIRAREDASDILQQVYLDARQRKHHYLRRPELSFYGWLRQLAAQRLIDVHRRHLMAGMRNAKQETAINRSSGAVESTSMAIQLAAQLASPSQVAMRTEMIRQLETTLAGLDPIDREIIALRHFEELRNCEIAELLGLNEAAASNRYMRALGRLRQTLAEMPDFDADGG